MKRALLSILFISFLGHVLAQAPVIYEGADNGLGCIGQHVNIIAKYFGTATTTLWEESADGGSSWNPISSNSVYDIHNGSASAGTGAYLEIAISNTSLDHHQYRVTLSNASGSSGVSAAAILFIAQGPPNQPAFVNPITNVCQGQTITYTLNGGLENDSIYWNLAAYGGIEDTVKVIHFPATGTVTVAASALNGCGHADANPINITINPLQPALAGTAGGGAVCMTSPVYTGVATAYTDAICSQMVLVSPSGTHPVTGDIHSCVTIDASVQSFGGVPYVPRHYSLEPALTDPTTSTATITLYFTQADFNAYNLARGSNPALPMGSSDVTGISNLRITQFHGTGTTPGTYVGGSGEINPDDNNIVWNASASRWEVTFDITGFSGFFASGGSLVPLPLTLVDFTGQPTENGNLLHWVTSSEENTAYFEVERKMENGAGTGNTVGDGFQPLAKIPAAGNSNQTIDYSYTDGSANGLDATLSYRLYMVDIDGKSTYSKIVTLQSPINSLSIRVLPNPSRQPLSLLVRSPQPGPATLTVTDMSGRTIRKQSLSLQKGENSLDVQWVSRLPRGQYLINVVTDLQKQTVKFISE